MGSGEPFAYKLLIAAVSITVWILKGADNEKNHLNDTETKELLI